MRHRPLPPLVALLALAACGIDQKETQRAIELIQQEAMTPDTLPVMRNTTLPFRYPHELYERKVQGQVTLRIFIDQFGKTAAESTRVEESSGYAGFDSAAVKGAEELIFRPAKKGSRQVAVSIRLPVYFRHPDAKPLPGDTVLNKPGVRKQ